MGSHRQTLLHDLTTLVAFLRGETRIDSYHLMTGSCSLIFKNSEKRAPTGVHDALCQGMILDHVENRKLLNSDHLIVFGVLFSNLEMMVTVFESRQRLPIEVLKRAYIDFTRACPS